MVNQCKYRVFSKNFNHLSCTLIVMHELLVNYALANKYTLNWITNHYLKFILVPRQLTPRQLTPRQLTPRQLTPHVITLGSIVANLGLSTTIDPPHN